MNKITRKVIIDDMSNVIESHSIYRFSDSETEYFIIRNESMIPVSFISYAWRVVGDENYWKEFRLRFIS